MILFHQPIAISQRLGLSAILVIPCNPLYDGVVLPEKDRFKYLGMLLDRRMNPKIAEEHAVRPYMAAQSRITEFAKSHELKSSCYALVV